MCVILFWCFSVPLALRLPRFGKRELIFVLFVQMLYICLLVLSVSSSSWCLERAAVCDCGTPWTSLLPFFGVVCFRYFKTHAMSWHTRMSYVSRLRPVRGELAIIQNIFAPLFHAICSGARVLTVIFFINHTIHCSFVHISLNVIFAYSYNSNMLCFLSNKCSIYTLV